MFKERLKELRLEAGITQRALAKELGVAQGAVGNWESGIREPNFETAQKIADRFGVTTDYLLGHSKERTIFEESLSGVSFALFGEAESLDDDDKADVLEFIRYKKMLKNKKKE